MFKFFVLCIGENYEYESKPMNYRFDQQNKKYTKDRPKILPSGTKVYYESDSLNITKVVEKSNGSKIREIWQSTIGWLPDSSEFFEVIENTKNGQYKYLKSNI